MSKQKHTAGPWRLEGSVIRGGRDDLNIFHVPVGIINDVAITGCPSRKEAKANARLIAVAPELLEALKGLVAWADNPRIGSLADLKKARAAIAKATGEQQ